MHTTLRFDPAPAPFRPDQACSHCGMTATACQAAKAKVLSALEDEWAAGTHRAQAGYKYDADPDDVWQAVQARTQNLARCCAGCTMHGYSR